jgi:cation diffusion facilitator family transporter
MAESAATYALGSAPKYMTRHSRAALQSAAEGKSSRTILIAFLANIIIAVAKLIAGLVSGSAAMLGEAGHSFADSLNEVLLGFSLRRARLPADAKHPLGYGRERFLWAFLASITSFLIGGCLSVALAIREFAIGSSTGDTRIAWIVLAISFVADGTSWLQGMRQARREARKWRTSVWRFLVSTSEPALRAVVVEDSAALAGLGIAASSLLLSQLSGSETPDAAGALLIGILLVLTAIGLARILGDFLVSRSLPRAQMERLHEIVSAPPAIAEVPTLRAVYIGPEEANVTARVHPAPNQTIDQLAHAMDQIDTEMRSAVPEVADVYLDITTYYTDTLPLNWDHGYDNS